VTYRAPVNESQKQMVWNALSAGSAAISVLVTRRVLTAVWECFGHEPPEGLEDRKHSWRSALTWAVATGVGIAVARVIAVRVSARAWQVATHEAPPASASAAA
jgi:hypothetical protein